MFFSSTPSLLPVNSKSKNKTNPAKSSLSNQITINRWTTIPLPTHKQWADATMEDPDLHLICEAIKSDKSLERHQLTKKAYFDAWDKGQLTYNEGILLFTEEPRAIDVRQLLRRVVPRTLRHIIITAFHTYRKMRVKE